VVIAVTRQFGSDAPERDSIVEVVGKVVDERYVDAFNMYYMPNLGVLRLLWPSIFSFPLQTANPKHTP
jgi:hypothetical protein